MAEYQLYCFAQSGNAYRAALMLNLIGADWKPMFVDFFAKACSARRNFAATSTKWAKPRCSCTAAKKLSQSGVILTYLAEHSRKFLPRSDDERLEALRWIIFDNQKVNGFLGPYRFLRNFAQADGHPGRARIPQRPHRQRVSPFSTSACRHAPYMLGAEPTIADLSLVAICIIRPRNSASTSPPSTRTLPPGSTASRRCPAGRIPTI